MVGKWDDYLVALRELKLVVWLATLKGEQKVACWVAQMVGSLVPWMVHWWAAQMVHLLGLQTVVQMGSSMEW